MHHEFDRFEALIEKYGYKMDGFDGIKQRCGLDRLKAADYIDDEVVKIAFVEFSDIRRQYHNLIRENNKISSTLTEKKCVESKILKKLCKKNLDSVIEEIINKFKDSLHIINEAKNKYRNLPESFSKKPYALLIIAPSSNEDKDCNKDEIARLLDSLNNRLILNLPEACFSGFRLLGIENYLASQEKTKEAA